MRCGGVTRQTIPGERAHAIARSCDLSRQVAWPAAPPKTSHEHAIQEEPRDRTIEPMPMIDVYAAVGTFSDKSGLAQELASALMRWEAVPEIPLFADNTAAFIHDLPPEAISTVSGRGDYVRVQVLTPAGVLDRDKQLGVVKALTEIVARAAGDPTLAERTWVLLTESPEGGWGIAGHANTQADIAATARAALSAGG
jgi:phenylpyruvate tautomerase PptA (4-oxalocrotonate tautomerase family)